MELIKKYLEQNYDISSNESELILSFHKPIKLKKGDFFIEQDKVPRSTGFLVDGLMRYFEYDKDGNDPTCYFSFPPHYVLDPFTFFEQKPAVTNAQAVNNCTLLQLSFENHKKLQSIFNRWGTISNELIMKLGLEFSNQKTLLSLNATDRYEYFENKYPQVARQAPLQFVASYLGIAAPSLSRIRKSRMFE